MVRSVLEAIANHFDWFFRASLDDDAVPSLLSVLASSLIEI